MIESNPDALYNLSDFDLYADTELPADYHAINGDTSPPISPGCD
jgi:hypothetical protein